MLPQTPERQDALVDMPLGRQLKVYFDKLTAEPAPDRLLQLTEALEQALERGELNGRCPRRS